jgi:biotin carboxyl carrier protein
MSLEIKINKRFAKVELLNHDGSRYKIKVDNKVYDLDVIPVDDGLYSILMKGKSFNIEVIRGENIKKSIVNTHWQSFETEVIDAEAKYLMSRGKGALEEGENVIISPMPGKIVSVLVKVGDRVEAGQTAVIISAMKMESEFKSKADGTVKEVYVKEGDTVDGNQVLIVIEPDVE